MGFQPTTLCDLVRCSTTGLLETLWRARVKLWVQFDWKHITQLHSHERAHMNSLTASRRHMMYPTNLLSEYTKRKVDSKKIWVPDGIWTHDPPWSSRMLYHWATGDSVVSNGQIVGIDRDCIAWLHSHVLVHMNSLTASRCHIKASHMNSLITSRRHIKAYRDVSNQPPKWVY